MENTRRMYAVYVLTVNDSFNERTNPKGIENLSLEDLDDVLEDFYTEIK